MTPKFSMPRMRETLQGSQLVDLKSTFESEILWISFGYFCNQLLNCSVLSVQIEHNKMVWTKVRTMAGVRKESISTVKDVELILHLLRRCKVSFTEYSKANMFDLQVKYNLNYANFDHAWSKPKNLSLYYSDKIKEIDRLIELIEKI